VLQAGGEAGQTEAVCGEARVLGHGQL